MTRPGLLPDGEYLWLESALAVRFVIEEHLLILRRSDKNILLSAQFHQELIQIACLAIYDPNFEDRLLVAIGFILDPVQQ